ncbi:hypothetical protein [Halobellus ruber]|uniref:hypothetical protein n=1 Tax=Halobellus ruber TaxID=2761102 RepID=UPI001FE5060C|nr:hypothetical protein [Halobellus ruber]
MNGVSLAVPVMGAAAGLGTAFAVLQPLPLPAGFPIAEFLVHCRGFPASILFSLVALASGVSGALFFGPFSVLVAGITPSQAIGAGPFTEVFRMGNALLNHVRQRVVETGRRSGSSRARCRRSYSARSPPTPSRRRY